MSRSAMRIFHTPYDRSVCSGLYRTAQVSRARKRADDIQTTFLAVLQYEGREVTQEGSVPTNINTVLRA